MNFSLFSSRPFRAIIHHYAGEGYSAIEIGQENGYCQVAAWDRDGDLAHIRECLSWDDMADLL